MPLAAQSSLRTGFYRSFTSPDPKALNPKTVYIVGTVLFSSRVESARCHPHQPLCDARLSAVGRQQPCRLDPKPCRERVLSGLPFTPPFR